MNQLTPSYQWKGKHRYICLQQWDHHAPVLQAISHIRPREQNPAYACGYRAAIGWRYDPDIGTTANVGSEICPGSAAIEAHHGRTSLDGRPKSCPFQGRGIAHNSNRASQAALCQPCGELLSPLGLLGVQPLQQQLRQGACSILRQCGQIVGSILEPGLGQAIKRVNTMLGQQPEGQSPASRPQAT